MIKQNQKNKSKEYKKYKKIIKAVDEAYRNAVDFSLKDSKQDSEYNKIISILANV